MYSVHLIYIYIYMTIGNPTIYSTIVFLPWDPTRMAPYMQVQVYASDLLISNIYHNVQYVHVILVLLLNIA